MRKYIEENGRRRVFIAKTRRRHIKQLFIGLLLLICGCTTAAQYPAPASPPLTWPPPPELPRIQFISSVTSPRDIGIRRSAFKKFLDYLAGKIPSSIVSPYGVETDAEGSVYAVDTYLKSVHVFDLPNNRYYRFPKEPGALGYPVDLAIDSQTGLIYISDSHRKVVMIYADKGKRFIGELGRGDLERPTGIAINQATSELLVVDTLSANIVRYTLPGHRMKGFFGTSGTQPGHLHFPTNLSTTPDGRIVVSDSLNFRVQVFASDGSPMNAFGERGNRPGTFSRPRGVAVDSEGHIYVVDALFDMVQIFDATGRLLMDFGGPGSDAGKFWLPTGIFIDQHDTIYISDSYNHRVQVFKYLKQGEAPK